jgi:hypothetical protein
MGSEMPRLGAGAGAAMVSTGSSTGVIAMMPRAVWRIACAAGSSGSVRTSGTPASAC